nr:pseudouridine synthase [Simiduia aestuariiviva]
MNIYGDLVSSRYAYSSFFVILPRHNQGDCKVPYSPLPEHRLDRQVQNPDIVYEDEHLVVINKPANMLSVPGKGPDKQDCAISRLQLTHPGALSVHRLDYATSGLLVVALTKDVHRALSKLFEQRLIHKRYLARVDGIVTLNEGEVDLPLICDWPNRPRQKVDFEQGKAARTLYAVQHRNLAEHSTTLELTPITGRSHQLRVHMQQLGHPILGDEFYADADVKAKASRLLLHAQWLKFEHPVTAQTLEISLPAPF